MATLSATELAELRGLFTAGLVPVTWTKSTINVVMQAVETWFEGNRASLGSAIETAAPGAFSVAQKAALVKFWLKQKYERGG